MVLECIASRCLWDLPVCLSFAVFDGDTGTDVGDGLDDDFDDGQGGKDVGRRLMGAVLDSLLGCSLKIPSKGLGGDELDFLGDDR